MTDVPYQIYRHNNIERAAVAMPMWGSLRLAPNIERAAIETTRWGSLRLAPIIPDSRESGKIRELSRSSLLFSIIPFSYFISVHVHNFIHNWASLSEPPPGKKKKKKKKFTLLRKSRD